MLKVWLGSQILEITHWSSGSVVSDESRLAGLSDGSGSSGLAILSVLSVVAHRSVRSSGARSVEWTLQLPYTLSKGVSQTDLSHLPGAPGPPRPVTASFPAGPGIPSSPLSPMIPASPGGPRGPGCPSVPRGPGSPLRPTPPSGPCKRDTVTVSSDTVGYGTSGPGLPGAPGGPAGHFSHSMGF